MRILLAVLLLLSPRPSPAVEPAAAGSPGQVVSGQTTITLPDKSAWSEAARKILDLEVERSAAIARHDRAWLSNLYAADFQGIAAGGRPVDREALLEIFSRDNPESRFLIDELMVRDFGATATVNGRLRMTTPSGQVVSESRYLHVYLVRDGHWWIVAAAGSLVPQRPS